MLTKILFIGLLCSFLTACPQKSTENKTSNTNTNSATTNNSAKTTNSNTTPKTEVKEISTSSENKSTFTSLETAKCKTTESNEEEGGSYIGECPGVGGYKLELTEGDLRQTINVIAPNKKKFELNFSQVSGGFSTLGEKAEWRMKGDSPVALIVRFNVADAEDSTKNTSHLIVSKVSATAACITDVVKPGAGQNEEAQKLADAASTKPCKSFN
ncbi:MAG TPA: hypothetical protein PKE69_23525 [Pyrinomonadaceae bacterium]|nr:hypothetical protein [Pyrinomonadaceae bacterium]